MIDYTGTISGVINQVFNLDKETIYDVVIKKHRKKRSLNANAYCWKIVTEIANVVRLSKEEVYLTMLKHYGQRELISVKANIDVSGYFKYYEIAGTSMLNGVEFIHYFIFKGSSEYDTKEMSILIDGIVQEATSLGIPTISDEELQKMKGNWNRDKKI
jgi:hypothetical protein